jgi:hypothetical protein
MASTVGRMPTVGMMFVRQPDETTKRLLDGLDVLIPWVEVRRPMRVAE